MPSILSLEALSTIRRKAGINRATISAITAAAGREITISRQKELENGPYRAEPWYDEALDLSRILLLSGITPLLATQDNPSGNLTQFNLGPPQADDVDLLLRGVRLPLSTACRITLKFGLTDPVDLLQRPIHMQVWDTIQNNERAARAFECPWCHAQMGEDHADRCLPANLWTPRTNAPYNTANAPKPLKPGTRGQARMAYGLKRVRKAARITQLDLAGRVGVHANYLSRMEQCSTPMTQANAENIARALNCRIADIYEATGSDRNAGQ